MNSDVFRLAEGLVPASYIRQGEQARHAREAQLKSLLSQRRLPDKGWDEGTLELVLHELALMDSNTFIDNAGVGEREGRVICPLVSRRHYGFAHGIGRSGDIAEPQPKAAGSSLMYRLTNLLATDALRRAGTAGVRESLVLPLATGMSVTLTLLALRQLRPEATHVVWPRIDQKSCAKAVAAAGLKLVAIENVLEGDELRTDVPAVEASIRKLKSHKVLCVLSTTSCFAPRVPDRLLEIGRLCADLGVAHVANNAYGVQCASCCKAIAAASRHGRLDAFVQSTDKNFLVPVGGAIVATADTSGHGDALLRALKSTYPGRASVSPILDLFCTLLHLGADGWSALLSQRTAIFPQLRERVSQLALKHGERLLETPHNSISMAVTLTARDGGRAPSALGAALFTRLVSGLRTVSPDETPKVVCGVEFRSYGAHADGCASAYFTVACALGTTEGDVELFLKRLDKALAEWKKPTSTKTKPNASALKSGHRTHAGGAMVGGTAEQGQGGDCQVSSLAAALEAVET